VIRGGVSVAVGNRAFEGERAVRRQIRNFASVGIAVAAMTSVIGTLSLLGRAAVQSVPSNAWSATDDLNAARAVAASTLLYDGHVLVTGGLDGNGAATASAERYSPEGGAFLETPSMLQARAHHTATPPMVPFSSLVAWIVSERSSQRRSTTRRPTIGAPLDQ
jgi:hypothetical protein